MFLLPGNHQWKVPRRQPNQRQMLEPPWLHPFRCRGAAALLQAPHPAFKAEPNRPAERAICSRLYLGSQSFSHNPFLIAVCVGWKVDRPVYVKSFAFLAQLFPQPDRHEQFLHYCSQGPVRLSISCSILTSFMNKKPS